MELNNVNKMRTRIRIAEYKKNTGLKERTQKKAEENKFEKKKEE